MLIADHRITGIGLGTAQFAFRDGTPEDAVATVHAALDAGVRLIDTALAYTRPGVESYAEPVVARALRPVTTDRPLVVTKGGHWREGGAFPVDGRPAALRAHCEVSLRTLGVDRIDLSNVTIEQLDAALTVAPVAAVQNKLSYADPGDLPTALACARRGAVPLSCSLGD